MLEVADRFGCTKMKLAAEYELVTAGINEVNAAEMFIFADQHRCALLREAAVDFFRAQPMAMMASDGWAGQCDRVSQSIAGAHEDARQLRHGNACYVRFHGGF